MLASTNDSRAPGFVDRIDLLGGDSTGPAEREGAGAGDIPRSASGGVLLDWTFGDPPFTPIIPAGYLTDNTYCDFTFDTTPSATAPAGYTCGAGFMFPLVLAEGFEGALTSDLSDYIVSFDASADGLLLPNAVAKASLFLMFNGPGGWQLQPSVNVNLGSLTTHYELQFDPQSYNGGRPIDELLTANNIYFGASFWDVRPDFGDDADNAVKIDNIRLETKRADTTPPWVQVQQVPNPNGRTNDKVKTNSSFFLVTSADPGSDLPTQIFVMDTASSFISGPYATGSYCTTLRPSPSKAKATG